MQKLCIQYFINSSEWPLGPSLINTHLFQPWSQPVYLFCVDSPTRSPHLKLCNYSRCLFVSVGLKN